MHGSRLVGYTLSRLTGLYYRPVVNRVHIVVIRGEGNDEITWFPMHGSGLIDRDMSACFSLFV